MERGSPEHCSLLPAQHGKSELEAGASPKVFWGGMREVIRGSGSSLKQAILLQSWGRLLWGSKTKKTSPTKAKPALFSPGHEAAETKSWLWDRSCVSPSPRGECHKVLELLMQRARRLGWKYSS